MKHLPLVVAILFCSCAELRIRNASGKTILRVQSNAQRIVFHYRNGGERIDLDITSLDNSTATLAGGTAFKMGADSILTGATSIVLAGGVPWAKGAAMGTQLLAPVLQTAAPVALQSRH